MFNPKEVESDMKRLSWAVMSGVLAASVLTALVSATPAQAANDCPATGHITYNLVRAPAPTPDQTDAYNRITAAMDKALASYNCHANLTVALSVHYNPSVPTADAAYGGPIRFGSRESMVQATAMHETAHTLGVGTYTGGAGTHSWASRVSGGRWTGSNAINELRAITGDPAAVVFADQSHFWPNGLNQPSEVTSPADYVNHIRMVLALRRDMGL